MCALTTLQDAGKLKEIDDMVHRCNAFKKKADVIVRKAFFLCSCAVFCYLTPVLFPGGVTISL